MFKVSRLDSGLSHDKEKSAPAQAPLAGSVMEVYRILPDQQAVIQTTQVQLLHLSNNHLPYCAKTGSFGRYGTSPS